MRDTVADTFHRALLLGITLLALLLASACAPEAEDQGPLEIEGSYLDQWGTTHTITSEQWSDDFGSAFHVLYYSNAADRLIAQNDAGNGFNPLLYSRFDWTRFSGDLYYCQSAFDADTPLEAEEGVADNTDPSANGCGGFSWTNLTP